MVRNMAKLFFAEYPDELREIEKIALEMSFPLVIYGNPIG